jgi:epoxyqueuosine reductase
MAAVLVIVTPTPQGFSLKFSNSPVKRARRRGYLRNVTVALGNSRDPSAIPALQSLLNDPEPLVRAHAAWALGKIRDENAKQALDQAVRCDNNISVLAEIRSALSEST